MAATFSADGWLLLMGSFPGGPGGDHEIFWIAPDSNGLIDPNTGKPYWHWEHRTADQGQVHTAAVALGTKGGRVTGGAKADAARANGALGGRPGHSPFN